jgi:hypothetical protein
MLINFLGHPTGCTDGGGLISPADCNLARIEGSMDANEYFRLKKYPNGTWDIRISNFRKLKRRADREVLVSFFRLFVGADRLLTFLRCIRDINGRKRHDLPTSKCDLMNIVLMTCGTIWEISQALTQLRKNGVRKYLKEPSNWDKLEDFRKKWEKDPRIRAIRNKIAFHFDRNACEIGFDEISKQRKGIILASGDTSKYLDGTLSVGNDAMLRSLEKVSGIRFDTEAFENVFREVANDHTRLPKLIEKCFTNYVDSLKAPKRAMSRRNKRVNKGKL